MHSRFECGSWVPCPHSGKLDHGWPESKTSQARSAQRCRVRSFSLHEAFVKQARDSTRQGALRKLVGASWSAQLRKLHCASCSAQVAPRKLLRQVGPCKWLPASCSVQIASCSVQVALRKSLCASCSRQGALRKLVDASWSAQVALCNLLCASCSAQVALKCKLHLATPARGPGRNQTRDPPVPGAGTRTTRQLPRTSSNDKSRKNLEFLHLHHADSRRGLREHRRNRKNHGFLHLDHADPRRGLRGHRRNRKKNHGFLHLDHADPRRGSIFV